MHGAIRVLRLRSYWRRERDETTLVIVPSPSAISIPDIERKREWVLIVDEVPQADCFKELRLLDTPFLERVPGGAAYGRLVSRGSGGCAMRLTKIARNRHGAALYEKLGPLAYRRRHFTLPSDIKSAQGVLNSLGERGGEHREREIYANAEKAAFLQ